MYLTQNGDYEVRGLQVARASFFRFCFGYIVALSLGDFVGELRGSEPVCRQVVGL